MKAVYLAGVGGVFLSAHPPIIQWLSVQRSSGDSFLASNKDKRLIKLKSTPTQSPALLSFAGALSCVLDDWGWVLLARQVGVKSN